MPGEGEVGRDDEQHRLPRLAVSDNLRQLFRRLLRPLLVRRPGRHADRQVRVRATDEGERFFLALAFGLALSALVWGALLGLLCWLIW